MTQQAVESDPQLVQIAASIRPKDVNFQKNLKINLKKNWK